jgi:DNA-binding Lrp family transcriptional regulator
MVTAVVLINTARGKVEETGTAIAAVPGVSEVFSVAGRVDLVANIRVKTNEELAEVVAQRLAAIEGVTATETLIAFRVYSQEDVEGAFSIGA